MKSLSMIALIICFTCFLPAEEKLLFSFEDAEVQKLLGLTKCKKIPGKTDKDPTTIDFNSYRAQGTWACFQDFKSHGEVSLGLSVSKLIYGMPKIGNESEKLLANNTIFFRAVALHFVLLGFLAI